jgi:hypothetical protein
MITIKEHQFQDRDNTLLSSRKQFCDINKMYGIKLNKCFYTNKCYISFELTCFGAEN